MKMLDILLVLSGLFALGLATAAGWVAYALLRGNFP